jgi:hypothetical protein
MLLLAKRLGMNFGSWGGSLLCVTAILLILFSLLIILENQAQLHLFRYGNVLDPEAATAQYRGIIFKIIPDAFYEEAGCSDILGIMNNVYMVYGAFVVSLSLVMSRSTIVSGYSISFFCGIGIYFVFCNSEWYHFAVFAFMANVIIVLIPIQFFEDKRHNDASAALGILSKNKNNK